MLKKRAGFTLVELLVVMGIIALLVAIGGANYIAAQKRGRNARREADIQQLRSALEMYRTDKNGYPPGGDRCDTSVGKCGSVCDSCGAGDFTTSTWSSTLETELKGGHYMTKMLKDPMNNTTYFYGYQAEPSGCDNSASNECTKYELHYKLESPNGALPTPMVEYNP